MARKQSPHKYTTPMMKIHKILCLAIAMLTMLTASAKQKATDNMLVVAYVTS